MFLLLHSCDSHLMDISNLILDSAPLQEELAASETKEAELQMELWQLSEVSGFFQGEHCPLSQKMRMARESEGFWRSVSEHCKTM